MAYITKHADQRYWSVYSYRLTLRHGHSSEADGARFGDLSHFADEMGRPGRKRGPFGSRAAAGGPQGNVQTVAEERRRTAKSQAAN